MKSKKFTARETPEETLQRIRGLISNGGRPTLETLSRDELNAAHTLISQGNAKIDSMNCRIILSAVLQD